MENQTDEQLAERYRKQLGRTQAAGKLKRSFPDNKEYAEKHQTESMKLLELTVMLDDRGLYVTPCCKCPGCKA